ncbi:hypothetical protein ACQKWADRAFT_322763 [Trichoderma austrokoningii]
MVWTEWQDSPEGLSPDWVLANNCNVHVCNDRKWFTELTTFSSTALNIPGSQELSIAGVGTVNLPVKRSPNFTGPRAHHILRLTDVLYMPQSSQFKDASGKPIAYFSPRNKLTCFKLSGPPIGPRLGPSKLKSNTVYLFIIQWPDSERARWKAHSEQIKTDAEQRQWIGEQPYTVEEKQWLKKHYEGEFKFLMAHGLKIHDEEDRAEGRAIMRMLAKNHDEEDDEEEDEEGEEEDSDLEGHFADYHFNEEELDCIEKHYRNSANFLISYGFKFYDDQDCAAAKRLLQDFLHE